jgi:phosphopantothenoylcysteine decarboxylase/phosphopantothenate--cysteine ligase
VILVAGPTHLTVSHSLIQVIPVVTARNVEACHQYFDEMDVVIAAAAVADYKPKIVATQKIKKGRDTLVIELEKTKIF